MTKQDFEILMNSLYSNNQLFIPQGQNIKEWIDNAFVEKQEEAINVIQCCKSDSDQLHTEVFKLANKLAINGYGNEAVKMHQICNGM